MRRLISSCFVLAAALSICVTTQAQDKKDHDHDHANIAPNGAVCKIRPTKGNKLFGLLTLKQKDGHVLIRGSVRGLTPGEHGFHIHQFGDMRGSDGKATGGHFNPKGHKHAGLDSKERHVGDFGNITADAEGVAKVNIKAEGLSLFSVIGRAFVVHGGKDDLKSQPSGAAGPRIGTGVIGIAGPLLPKPAAKPAAKPAK